MANHCYNYGYFEGNAKQISKLITALETERAKQLKEEYTDKGVEIPSYTAVEGISLWAGNYSLILSEEADEYTKPDYDVYNLYGSKWFECEWEQYSDTEVQLVGDSAWSPMLPFFQKICIKYQLEGHGNYAESGMDFAGEFTIDKKGNLTNNEMSYQQYEADNNPDSFFNNVLYLISDGDFNTFDEVLNHFQNVNWTLSQQELDRLKTEYSDYLLILTDK